MKKIMVSLFVVFSCIFFINSTSYAAELFVLGNANLREGPSTEYAILGSAYPGQKLYGSKVPDKDWYKLDNGLYITALVISEQSQATETESVSNNIATNYVVVNIDNQYVALKNEFGETIVDGPCVSGNASTSPTPRGTYYIYFKSMNQYLMNNSFVKYWMPFNGGIGLHDADGWRYEYGGGIYQYAGSHGCVNLPEWLAECIYNNVVAGTKVIVE